MRASPVIRPAREDDAKALSDLHALCHPTWPERTPLWWWTHPTLVLEFDDNIVGSTSFSVSLPPSREFVIWGDEVLYGHGVAVHPAFWGQGFGSLLAEARHQVGRDLGVKLFIGMTWPENAPMRRIFERQHLRRRAVVPKAYAWHTSPSDGWVYIGAL